MFKTRKSKRFVRNITYLAPNIRIGYRIAKMYVDNYNGVNNSDMFGNGELPFLQKAISAMAEPIIFDVGANRGQWCEQAVSFNPAARVFCFEPVKQTYEKLVENTRGKSVTCFQIGLGDRQGSMQINIYGNISEMNSIYVSDTLTPLRTEEISLDTIDNFCQHHNIEHIDYLKIDTEGNDFAVLRGAEAQLQSGRIKFAQFEYGSNYIYARVFLRDVFEFISSMPYDLFRIMPRGSLHIPKYSPSLDNFEHSNYVLVRRTS